MPIFSEIYGTYYFIVNQILMQNRPLSADEIRAIIQDLGYNETLFHLEPQLLQEGNWDLLHKKEQTFTPKLPAIPPVYRELEKRFLKTILEDARMALFLTPEEQLEWQNHLKDVPPLFSSQDIFYFDQFADGDMYTDSNYIRCFKVILEAIQTNKQVYLEYENARKNQLTGVFSPQILEFSQKNDRFRLHAKSVQNGTAYILNVKQIHSVTLMAENAREQTTPKPVTKTIHCTLYNRRNALERAMLHFASYQKTTKRIDDKTYELVISYPAPTENELLIQILSFGPMLRVTAPSTFIRLLKQRLQRQTELSLGD
ncbi:WYL domain-containing protein [Listeria sp. ILCC797]|uniref:WYL domain-containing protein n=1 Tax=Listeria sp. ILCC797 TaxID=1918333 RepID=UPI000B591473|nr:WYL domain-containing protein [Listeria sp. ILCC797]